MAQHCPKTILSINCFRMASTYLNLSERIRINNRFTSAFLFVFFLTFFASYALAADPGHGAAVIWSGTFESGNYVFPSNLNRGGL